MIICWFNNKWTVSSVKDFLIKALRTDALRRDRSFTEDKTAFSLVQFLDNIIYSIILTDFVMDNPDVFHTRSQQTEFWVVNMTKPSQWKLGARACSVIYIQSCDLNFDTPTTWQIYSTELNISMMSHQLS